MNKPLLAVLALLPFALAACDSSSSSDFRYNEVVTPAFLHNVQRIDRDMRRLIKGDFDSGRAVAATRPVESPAGHIAELEHDLNQVQQLQHGEDASRFASSLSRYYELQIGYYQNLRRYAETGDKARKEALAQELHDAYQALHVLPDQVLAAQKQFLERANLPH
ncbi:hypothetical protein [Pseudomonas multiresinivorans]|uniref:Lipoprotein n=1 Tax=Pseudomonas multiresinivorans TaxID=95301 RepID=A0A7Z3GNG0_9PSED|nr:hypothetical protein [Pseudomonas multiresinivorans]QJP06649.1 hypothetical protein G4G71_01690 [Pseudomonas multiresinivorans]